MCKKINISAPLPTFGVIEGSGRPAIFVDDEYHYIISERGKELSHTKTKDLDRLLYLVFIDISFTEACKYELLNRDENIDSRRIVFKKQEDILGMLKKDWRSILVEKHKEIILRSPFDDFATKRVDLYKSLKDNGMSDEDAWKNACKEYPKPGG